MKAVPEGYELADEPQPWVMRNPGVTLTLAGTLASAALILFGTWIDDRQRPQWDKIEAAMAEQLEEMRLSRAKQSRKTEQLATFNLERYRYSTTVWSLIAESANVKLPPRPKELDRAEDRVRDIQEGAN